MSDPRRICAGADLRHTVAICQAVSQAARNCKHQVATGKFPTGKIVETQANENQGLAMESRINQRLFTVTLEKVTIGKIRYEITICVIVYFASSFSVDSNVLHDNDDAITTINQELRFVVRAGVLLCAGKF